MIGNLLGGKKRLTDNTAVEGETTVTVNYFGYNWMDEGQYDGDGNIVDPSVIMDIENWTMSYEALQDYAAEEGYDVGLLVSDQVL